MNDDENDDRLLVRQALTQKDVDDIYASGYASLFTIKLHHGGKFTRFPDRIYVDGKIDHIDMIDIDKFCVHDLDHVMLRLGYNEDEPIYYHFLVPGKNLDYDLQPLSGDSDILKLSKLVPPLHLIYVYTEHGRSSVPIVSQSTVRIEELPAEQIGIDDIELGEFTYDKQFEGGCSVTRGQQTDDVLNHRSSSGCRLIENQPNVVEANFVHLEDGNEVDGEGVNADYDDGNEVDGNEVDGNEVDGEGVNSDYDDGNEVDGNEVVNHDDVDGNEEEDKKGYNEDDDGDYIADEDNGMDDYDVDMRDYKIYVDSDVEELLDDDEDIEDEVVDSESFLQPRSGLEEGNNLFYLGQLFGTKKECKKLIRAHAVETRRDIRIIKDEDDRVRAVCKGGFGDVGSSSGQRGKAEKDKGVASQKTKFQGAASQKTKGKGATSQKDNSQGVILENEKGKGVSHNLGERGKKTNPHPFQCPWVLLLSKVGEKDSWCIRTLLLQHKCQPVRKSYACTSTYLSTKLVHQVAENPEIPVKAIQDQFQRELQLRISKMQAFRAKVKAKKEVHGDYISQYAYLRDYVNELRSKNPGTTVKIEVEAVDNPDLTTRKFKRIYICLGALKNGFKAIGRDLLGLDGAFMKGPFPGQILSAVGIDPNNSIYPVCYAIVEAENLSSWTWFLECLGEDLDLDVRSNFTFVSDRQKGLLPAMANVFPSAEHRYCLRHIHENFKGTFKGKEYKDMLWKAATSTTVVHFKRAMDVLKEFNTDAHEWLSKIPPEHWSRSHFSGRALSDVLLNNMCEVFNGKICEGRDKPIYSALEFIREYLIRRIVTALKTIEKSEGLLTPTTTKLFEKNKNEAAGYTATWNGGELYQVTWNGGSNSDQVVVNLEDKTCACRRWELTRIPCKHAVAAIWIKSINSEEVGYLESWVNPVYSMERWKQVYSFRINPINGRGMWEDLKKEFNYDM